MIGLGWKLHTQQQRLLDLEDYFAKTSIDDDSLLARRAARLLQIDEGDTYEQSKRLWKQLTFIHNQPCVTYIPERGGLGATNLYCFSDLRGTKLVLREVPRPPLHRRGHPISLP